LLLFLSELALFEEKFRLIRELNGCAQIIIYPGLKTSLSITSQIADLIAIIVAYYRAETVLVNTSSI